MAGNGDMQVHEATYHKVIGLLKWGGIASFFIAAAVIFAITR